MTTQALDKTVSKPKADDAQASRRDPTQRFREMIGKGVFTTEAGLRTFAEPAPPAEEEQADDGEQTAEGGGEVDGADESAGAQSDEEPSSPPRAKHSLAEIALIAKERAEQRKKNIAAGRDPDDDGTAAGGDSDDDKGEDGKEPEGADKADGGGQKAEDGSRKEEGAKKSDAAKPGDAATEPAVAVRKRVVKPDPLPPIEELKTEPKTDAPVEEQSVDERAGFSLDDETREYLETVAYVEKTDPKKKGLFAREVKRIQEVNDYMANWAKAHPGEEFDPNFDDETKRSFTQLRQAKAPALNRTEVRTAQRAQMRDEAVAEARNIARAETEPLHEEITRLKSEPVISKTVDGLEKRLAETLPADLLKVYQEKGLTGLADADPIMGGTVAAVIEGGKAVAREYLKIHRGLIKPDLGKPSEDGTTIVGGNQTHQYISKLITKGAEWFAENGGEGRIQDGKRFVTPAQMARLRQSHPGTANAKYWTFGENHVVEIIHLAAVDDLKTKVEETSRKLEQREKNRQTAAAAKKADGKAPTDGGTEADEAGQRGSKKPSPRVSPAPAKGSEKKPAKKSVLDGLMTATNAGKRSA